VPRRVLFLVFFSLQRQRIRSRSVLQNAPRGGRCPCTVVRGGLAGKREIGMRRKRGFSVHIRTSRLHTAPLSPLSVSLSISLSFSLSSPFTPFRSVVRQISRSYGNTMVDDVESGGGC